MRLKILSWNAQSFRNKKSDFLNFINENTFHIILLQETWLNEKVDLSIPNFSCLRKDRVNTTNSRNPHGGVLIFVHNSINAKSVQFCHLNFVESVFIRIQVSSFAVTIGSIYSSAALTRAQSAKDLSKLISQPEPFILAGDFNAKHSFWNNINNCKKGEDLFKFCSQHSCSVNFPDEPTLFPAIGAPSIVDFVITKGVFGLSKPKSNNIFTSDHLPITFDFPFDISFPQELKVKNFNKANWKIFREKFSSSLEAHNLLNLSFDNLMNIDLHIDALNKILVSASEASVPLIKPFAFK